MFATLSFSLVACNTPSTTPVASRPSYDDIVSVCSNGEEVTLVWEEWEEAPSGSWFGAAPMPITLSEECISELGESVGLDWDAFGQEPAEVTSPSTVTDLLLAGVAQLVLSDFGTSEEVFAVLMPDELLTTALPPEGGVQEAVASELYFDFLADNVTGVVPQPDDSCLFRYEDGTVLVCFDDSIFETPYDRSLVIPPFVAALLMHEAAHSIGPNHVDAGGRWMDEDCSGTYGLQARVLTLWLDQHPDLDALNYDVMVDDLEDTCAHIMSRGDGCACDYLGW
ncbi:MAG: hypothetical protein ACOZNI_16285 [Myxococcota bacterium]